MTHDVAQAVRRDDRRPNLAERVELSRIVRGPVVPRCATVLVPRLDDLAVPRAIVHVDVAGTALNERPRIDDFDADGEVIAAAATTPRALPGVPSLAVEGHHLDEGAVHVEHEMRRGLYGRILESLHRCDRRRHDRVMNDEILGLDGNDLLRGTDSFPDGFLPGGKVPQDGWGRELHYERAPDGSGYALRSLGPDGIDQQGAGDDVRLP